MSPESDRKWTRRSFIALGVAGLSAVAGTAGWRRWRTIGSSRHVPGPATDGALGAATQDTVVQFLGAQFGVSLTDADVHDLAGRLDFAVRHDSGWLAEYEWLAHYLDELAQDAGQRAFVAAPEDVRDAVMREAIGIGVPGRTQRLRAFFSLHGRQRLRMRRSTLPQLRRLYRRSGVPWRQRGYTSWPGRPDDRLAYTRPLEGFRC